MRHSENFQGLFSCQTQVKCRFMRLKRSFCGCDKTDRHCQDNDGSQKEDFVEGHRHRHRFDRDVGAADKKCR